MYAKLYANQAKSEQLCIGMCSSISQILGLFGKESVILCITAEVLISSLLFHALTKKKMVRWESVGLSGIRCDPPYAYYLLATCSLPLMVDYVRVSWYSLRRAFSNAG